MKIKDFQNIAIIQTAFLGDVVLSLYLFAKIKELNPTARLTLVTTKEATDLARISLDIDEVITFDKKGKHKSISTVMQFGREVSLNKFDLVLNLHKSFRSTLLTYLIKSDTKVCFSDAVFSFLFRHKVRYFKHFHEWQRSCSILLAFEDFNVHELEQLPSINQKLKSCEINPKSVVIAPGSVWKTKIWGVEKYSKLAQELIKQGYSVIIIGSNADKFIGSEIVRNIESDKIQDYTGKLDITESIKLISGASLVIANDSAPTHFASVLNIPTVTIFGPTSPIFGFTPLADKSRTIFKNLECSPCHHHGLKKCPLGHHKCMQEISSNEVLQNAIEVLTSD